MVNLYQTTLRVLRNIASLPKRAWDYMGTIDPEVAKRTYAGTDPITLHLPDIEPLPEPEYRTTKEGQLEKTTKR